MALQNCRLCGKLIVPSGLTKNYCPECELEFLEAFRKIRDFVRTYPNKTMWDVHTELNIPLSLVQLVLKEFQENEKK